MGHALVAPLGDDGLKTAKRFVFVEQGEPQQRTPHDRFLMWPGGDPARYLRRVAGELRLVFRAGDRYKAAAIRRA